MVVRGRLYYSSEARLLEVAEYLQGESYMDEDFRWIGQDGEPRAVNHPISDSEPRLDIPLGWYRNLNRVFHRILQDATAGKVVATTLDGEHTGYIIEVDEPTEVYDLLDWWSKQGNEVPDSSEDRRECIARAEKLFHRKYGVETVESDFW